MTSTTEAMLARRATHLSPSQSLLYSEPLHIVRGDGAYLYDADGLAYLDCMNNVPHVGHSHPRVTEAVTHQMAQVNINTRFLYEPLLAYAERLTGLFSDALSVCFFVNSGSEANELALRLARTHAGRHGAVVLDGAYHGHTSSLIDLSPYKFDGPGGTGRPPHVQVAPTPDPYRGRFVDTDAAGMYADEVGAALRRGATSGNPTALFIAEPLMGCAGQIEPPEGFLPTAYERAREAGAVAVADEVQIGFGRVGTHMWAVDALGARPDIVTLGKPIGNSYPLGAVITTPEIAGSFHNGMEYFNTFGGSPVACAAGLAVLDVIEDEGLQQNALMVGGRLTAGFARLATRHSCIGNIRGRGLFLGVELVEDPVTRTPATALASDLVATLRREQILLTTEGTDDNVLKIKPPLCFSHADADRLLETVDNILATRR